MKFNLKIFILSIFVIIIQNGYSQYGSLGGATTGGEDEKILYMMNKQVNQFTKRFNLEEDQYGKPLSKNSKYYHNQKIRKELLEQMFDIYNPRTSSSLKRFFIEDVTNSKKPIYLHFLDNNWFAEVSIIFTKNGEDQYIILYLTLEEAGLGSKWVISNVYYNYTSNFFPAPDTNIAKQYFLHPQSHELDFMNLNKVLNNPSHIQYYASSNFKPDYLTLFFYLMKTGQLKFKEIVNVKFHFFQIPNWYFELSYYNRNEINSGWLISNLKYIKEDKKKELIRFYKSCTEE
jgi:hypothetical protein